MSVLWSSLLERNFPTDPGWLMAPKHLPGRTCQGPGRTTCWLCAEGLFGTKRRQIVENVKKARQEPANYEVVNTGLYNSTIGNMCLPGIDKYQAHEYFFHASFKPFMSPFTLREAFTKKKKQNFMKKFRVNIKLCHWFPKVPFFKKDFKTNYWQVSF